MSTTKTIVTTTLPERPDGHRPTRVYTVVVGPPRRSPLAPWLWTCAWRVRERHLEALCESHASDRAAARVGAARQAIAQLLGAPEFSAMAHELPVLRVDVIYEDVEEESSPCSSSPSGSFPPT